MRRRREKKKLWMIDHKDNTLSLATLENEIAGRTKPSWSTRPTRTAHLPTNIFKLISCLFSLFIWPFFKKNLFVSCLLFNMFFVLRFFYRSSSFCTLPRPLNYLVCSQSCLGFRSKKKYLKHIPGSSQVRAQESKNAFKWWELRSVHRIKFGRESRNAGRIAWLWTSLFVGEGILTNITPFWSWLDTRVLFLLECATNDWIWRLGKYKLNTSFGFFELQNIQRSYAQINRLLCGWELVRNIRPHSLYRAEVFIKVSRCMNWCAKGSTPKGS